MCLRHLAAIQQDLTLSLAQIDAGGEEVDPATTPSLLAAAILQEDTSFAGDAAATADAVRRLLAQLVVSLEDACLRHRSSRSDSPEALHARLRAAEDLGNLLRQSDTVLRADLATMSEDLDVAVSELGLRRNQVVALTLRLSSAAAPWEASRIGDAAPASTATGAGAGASADPGVVPSSSGAAMGSRRSREQSGGATACADAAAGGESAGMANGLVPSVALATRLAAAEAENRELRQVTEGRAAELRQALEDRQKIEADAIAAAATSRGPPSTSLVLGSALYQTMEATLQQLAVSQRSWNRERAAIVEDTASEAAATSRELTRVREWSASLLDDLSRQLAEALKTAEAAALARDRLHTTYEAKKLDAAGRPAPDAEAVLRQTLERHVSVGLLLLLVCTWMLSACARCRHVVRPLMVFPWSLLSPQHLLTFRLFWALLFSSDIGMYVLGDAEDSGDRSRSAQGQAGGLPEAVSSGRRQSCCQCVGTVTPRIPTVYCGRPRLFAHYNSRFGWYVWCRSEVDCFFVAAVY